MSRGTTLNFYDLWAPILLATFYYLAAAVVFPRDREQFAHLHLYFAVRKTFVAGLIFAAEIVDHIANLGYFVDNYRHNPVKFWGFQIPYNVAIDSCMLALLLIKGRRANIVLLAVLILLFLVPYWNPTVMDRAIERVFGY